MKFNKYINQVGIEFEGLYTESFLRKIKPEVDSFNIASKLIREIKGDGSVGFSYDDKKLALRYYCQEAVTKPLVADQLTQVLDLFQSAESARHYIINQTCGLHFHISLKNNYYYHIFNDDFFMSWTKMFEKISPKVFNDRRDNRYCKFRHSADHFRTFKPDDRYTLVNYPYQEHGTVEFRGYGGRYATIAGLEEIIQATIDLIGDFIPAYNKKIIPVKDNMVVEKENKKIKNNISPVPFPIIEDSLSISQNTDILQDLDIPKNKKRRCRSFKIVSLEKEAGKILRNPRYYSLYNRSMLIRGDWNNYVYKIYKNKPKTQIIETDNSLPVRDFYSNYERFINSVCRS